MNTPYSENLGIYVDKVKGVEQFLGFWKLPFHTTRQDLSNAHIFIFEEIPVTQQVPDHSLVMLTGQGERDLYCLDNEISLFAAINRISSWPRHLEVIASVKDSDGQIVSCVLKDVERKIVYVPFVIDEVIDNFHRECYLLKRKTIIPELLLAAYYRTKTLIPQDLRFKMRTGLARLQAKRRFPKWPIDLSLEELKRLLLLLLLSVSRTGMFPIIWFWPRGKVASLVLTHDVENSLNENPGIYRLLAVELSAGYRSAYNIVPFKYDVDEKILAGLRETGCEIGLHDYSHDGKLFLHEELFVKRIQQVNQIAKLWGSVGFRAGSTYRNPDWFHYLEFEYDASFFDTDPFEPQPGGCLSVFPYFIGEVLEIPLTMPQDHTVFRVLNAGNIDIWKEKSREIKRVNGMICLVSHPDRGYIGDEDKLMHYTELLETFSNTPGLWNPLPRELAAWWRRRTRAKITMRGNALTILNGVPDMHIRLVKARDKYLGFEDLAVGPWRRELLEDEQPIGPA